VTRTAAAVLLSAATLLAACGYTTRSLVADRYRTIAVPVFANETRRRDLEYEVTRAVVEEIQARTHLRVVAQGDEPDLVLVGRLRDVDEETLSRRENQRIREGAYFLAADVDVTDRRTGEAVVKDRKVVERESYVPGLGEDVRTARAEATRALAERVVRTLETGW
jgi:hypothetical protein